ncbi:MAG: glutathione S-transferase [SAR86 cluster bacterium]|nr:glutathione S-transferase [SAR86 cluster bacterium]
MKIFSYLPNPRVWKSIIAGRISGVEVEVIGDKPNKLSTWLWDFNPRKMEEKEMSKDSSYARIGKRGFSGILYKTDEFLKAHPFGTVPAAFSPEGDIGVFESNSILRAVARVGKHGELYGKNNYEASRIDSYLDANLVFAREAQVYLLEIENLTQEGFDRMSAAYDFYLNGIETSLANSQYIAGNELTIADISFVCDFAQFLREGHYEEILTENGFGLISKNGPKDYPLVFKHLLELSDRKEFSSVMGTYLDWYRKKRN